MKCNMYYTWRYLLRLIPIQVLFSATLGGGSSVSRGCVEMCSTGHEDKGGNVTESWWCSEILCNDQVYGNITAYTYGL